MKQTILGSGGAIGIPLARELITFTSDIRLVSRNPKKVNETDELFPADLSNRAEIIKAVEGSSVVYVTVGFPYNLKAWQQTWPAFIGHVIDACLQNRVKLVFFDNIYMYSTRSLSLMTEDAIIDPPSRKGMIRNEVRCMIMDAVEKRNLTALIARSADFYGPDNRNSILDIMVADNLRKGKKAQLFGNPGAVHTYTYTPDAAKATAILGNTPDAFNREWHVPTSREKITQEQWIRLIADVLGKEAAMQTPPRWLIRLLGLFIPVMREFPEMLYQYESDYIFDSTRFEKRFDIHPTPVKEGIKNTYGINK